MAVVYSSLGRLEVGAAAQMSRSYCVDCVAERRVCLCAFGDQEFETTARVANVELDTMLVSTTIASRDGTNPVGDFFDVVSHQACLLNLPPLTIFVLLGNSHRSSIIRLLLGVRR